MLSSSLGQILNKGVILCKITSYLCYLYINTFAVFLSYIQKWSKAVAKNSYPHLLLQLPFLAVYGGYWIHGGC